MAPLTLVSLFFLFYLSSSTHLHPYQTNSSPKSYDIIREACNATRFPTTCETVLIQSGNISINPKPIDIIKTTISISTHNLKTAQDMVKTILDDDLNRTLVVETCLKVLRFSEYRFSLVARVLPRHELKDARAYLSAALLYQVDCWSGLTKVNGTKQANEMVNFVQTLTQLTSNALSMVVSYDRFGNKTSLWKPPMTERDGYWELASGIQGGDSGSKHLFPVNLTTNVTVCKEDGVGCYRKIQEAVNRAPDNDEGGDRFVILIKEGVYKEIVRIPLHKRNIVFVGEGIGKTVITGFVNVRPGVSTYNTATVGVLGDGFMARDLTFENTAGPDAHQAVAYRSDSDQSIIENCEFLGHQDTLYARALRQLYISCRIEGNVDFIFGNSAAVFHNSTILIRPRQISPENGETNVVAAHGRTDPAQSTGFVFRNCTITGTEEYMKLYHENPKVHNNYLGRPWKEFSRTVFINSYLADLINPDGWMPWDGDFALSTLYYGELENYGQGANLSARVSWSNKIPEQFIDTYSIQNFIQADDWVSSSLY